MKRDVEVYIEDIMESISKIEEYTKTISKQPPFDVLRPAREKKSGPVGTRTRELRLFEAGCPGYVKATS